MPFIIRVMIKAFVVCFCWRCRLVSPHIVHPACAIRAPFGIKFPSSVLSHKLIFITLNHTHNVNAYKFVLVSSQRISPLHYFYSACHSFSFVSVIASFLSISMLFSWFDCSLTRASLTISTVFDSPFQCFF